MRPDTRAGTITRGWWWGTRLIEGGEERGALTGRMTDGYSVTRERGEGGERFPPPCAWCGCVGGGENTFTTFTTFTRFTTGRETEGVAVRQGLPWQGTGSAMAVAVRNVGNRGVYCIMSTRVAMLRSQSPSHSRRYASSSALRTTTTSATPPRAKGRNRWPPVFLVLTVLHGPIGPETREG